MTERENERNCRKERKNKKWLLIVSQRWEKERIFIYASVDEKNVCVFNDRIQHRSVEIEICLIKTRSQWDLHKYICHINTSIEFIYLYEVLMFLRNNSHYACMHVYSVFFDEIMNY